MSGDKHSSEIWWKFRFYYWFPEVYGTGSSHILSLWDVIANQETNDVPWDF